MERINTVDLTELFQCVAAQMSEQADVLTEMDARMGDGDLGLTMQKGFASLPEILDGLDEPDIGKKLMKAAMKMASVVPSTMGTLMSSGMMTGGKALSGRDDMDASSFLAYLRGFEEGIKKRGKCERGDRTVLDAIGAAADAVEDALQKNPSLSLDLAAEQAVSGARIGVEATKSMVPKFGKAAVHKDAAAGCADQGATAALCMLEGYCRFFTGKNA